MSDENTFTIDGEEYRAFAIPSQPSIRYFVGVCHDCRHFSPGASEPNSEGWGSCDKMSGDAFTGPKPGVKAFAHDGNVGYEVAVLVSPEFGCMMFEEKP